MRLGRLKSLLDPRTLRFADLLGDLPAAPMALSMDDAVPDVVDAHRNFDLGDCTCASIAYLEEVWTGHGTTGALLTTDEVVGFYSEVGGYREGEPSTDGGASMLDVLKRWRSVGIGAARRRCTAFVKVDHTDLEHVCSAIELLGGVYVGAELPNSARSSAPWAVLPGADGKVGGWGGHCLTASRYDHTGLTFRTWGRRQRADWSWWLTYVDECYAVLSPEWRCPGGLDTMRLQQMLNSLG